MFIYTLFSTRGGVGGKERWDTRDLHLVLSPAMDAYGHLQWPASVWAGQIWTKIWGVSHFLAFVLVLPAVICLFLWPAAGCQTRVVLEDSGMMTLDLSLLAVSAHVHVPWYQKHSHFKAFLRFCVFG